MYYAVIDTNVLVSALLSKNSMERAPYKVIEYIFCGELIPIYNKEILEEYEEVLKREKFHFTAERIHAVIHQIIKSGIQEDALQSEEIYPDPEDAVFFEVALAHHLENDNDTYLVTGNMKHFPARPFVVTPRQMVEIIENLYN